jgi:hypothetical protein
VTAVEQVKKVVEMVEIEVFAQSKAEERKC